MKQCVKLHTLWTETALCPAGANRKARKATEAALAKAKEPSSGGKECTGRGIEASNADHARAGTLVAGIRGHWSRHNELVVLQQGEARVLKEAEMLNVMRAKAGKFLQMQRQPRGTDQQILARCGLADSADWG